MGFCLLVVGLILFASWQYRIDLGNVRRDYEEWKRNRR
jgi:hypothetical protein